MNHTMYLKEHEKLCKKRFVHFCLPPFVPLERCVRVTWKLYLNHLTAGGGDPLKATVSLAGCPSVTVTGSKFLVKAGANESWACNVRSRNVVCSSVVARWCLSPLFWIPRITTQLRCFLIRNRIHITFVLLSGVGVLFSAYYKTGSLIILESKSPSSRNNLDRSLIKFWLKSLLGQNSDG